MGFSRDGSVIFKNKGDLSILDVKSNTATIIYSCDGISNALITKSGQLIVSSFFQIHTVHNQEKKQMEDKEMEEPICMILNKAEE